MNPFKLEIKTNYPDVINPLGKFRGDVFTQSGEDGLIEYIFDKIKPLTHSFVEFGAWDGLHYSNCANLVFNKGWNGVAIEADPDRFLELKENYSAFPVECINKFVGFSSHDNLGSILNESSLKNIDLLSIDVDGIDYWIWKEFTAFEPAVVIVEVNPSIPNDVIFIQERNMNVQQGSSLLAFLELSRLKGYQLIATTGANAIFVREDLYPVFGITDNSISAMYQPKCDGRVFHCFDGHIYQVGMSRLIWNQSQPVGHSDLIYSSNKNPAGIRSIQSLTLDELSGFTNDFTVPILSRMHLHSASPDSAAPLDWGSLTLPGLAALTVSDVARMCHYAEAIPSLESTNFAGKTVLILGSSAPWLEIYLLLKNARFVMTVEYRSINWGLDEFLRPLWSSVTYDRFQEVVEQGETDHSIDTVISYSSIEHSGLGRYGDDLNPDADIETLSLISKYVAPTCDYYLALPIGSDAILFNRHRVYGERRLQRVATALNRDLITKIPPKEGTIRFEEISAEVMSQSLEELLSTPVGSDGFQCLLRL